jgi:hypothetical protein
MRKFLITLAAAVSAVAVAAPASAQVYGNLGIGYGNPYGNAYGYNNGYQNVQRLRNQLQQVRYQMRNLAVQGRLTRAEARDLNRDIFSTERALRRASYAGLSPYEARVLRERVQRLRWEVRRYADYDGRRGYGYYNGHNADRDWDGDRDWRD